MKDSSIWINDGIDAFWLLKRRIVDFPFFFSFGKISQTFQKKLAETIEELGIGQQNSKLYDDEETDSDIDWNLNDETSLKDDLDWTSDSSEDDLDWTSDLSEDEES